jgi:hypothetical protein
VNTNLTGRVCRESLEVPAVAARIHDTQVADSVVCGNTVYVVDL